MISGKIEIIKELVNKYGNITLREVIENEGR